MLRKELRDLQGLFVKRRQKYLSFSKNADWTLTKVFSTQRIIKFLTFFKFNKNSTKFFRTKSLVFVLAVCRNKCSKFLPSETRRTCDIRKNEIRAGINLTQLRWEEVGVSHQSLIIFSLQSVSFSDRMEKFRFFGPLKNKNLKDPEKFPNCI